MTDNLILYTLFTSYRHGDHYCGVYPSLEELFAVISEMAADMDIPEAEVPALSAIKDALSTERDIDDFWHEFSDSTWIQVQKVADDLTRSIIKAVKGSV